MAETDGYIVVITTSPDQATAEMIAGQLVEDFEAACVQIVPAIKSFFRWQGKLEHAEEHLMLIKTRADKYDEIESKIRNLHPYEVPEIIAVPVTAGLSDYLIWINDNTKRL